jgi:predicted DNA-binding transcriptional regulator AlpA
MVVPKLLDSGEVCAVLNVSERWLRYATASGRVPGCVRLGPRCVRWRADALASWVDAGCPEQWQAAGSGNAGISAETSGELDGESADFDRVCDDGISDDC